MADSKAERPARVELKPESLWTQYRVTWLFLTKLCGSVPADPELQKKWIEARQPKAKPPGGRSIGSMRRKSLCSRRSRKSICLKECCPNKTRSQFKNLFKAR